ncbi:hypothetical protein C6Q15_01055 [Burkholderia multivorans]|uniref:Uncharacterized protein n=1 Tax=Burkholderia multivorans TaxID=87883 RepID=A0A2S9N2T5_9BURK|nr:hypothetical protein C6Q07_18305 [Burkholderia multivorans]PRF66932.1 hypothetical protein C6Q15_01055 [Burkholderia multivorans]
MIIGNEFFGGKYRHRTHSCWQCERREKENGSQIQVRLLYLTTAANWAPEVRGGILNRLIVD